MARPIALAQAQLEAALEGLADWSLRDGRLHAEFEFADLTRAFGFMAAAATEAARLDHHPEWSNSYSRVTVGLVTHDVGGVTELDIELATRMSALAKGFTQP